MGNTKEKRRKIQVIREPDHVNVIFLTPEAEHCYFWLLRRAIAFAQQNRVTERQFLEDAARTFRRHTSIENAHCESERDRRSKDQNEWRDTLRNSASALQICRETHR